MDRREWDMGERAKAGVTKRASLLLAALAATLALFPATAGAVVPELLANVPESNKSGSGANQLGFPQGIAADPNLPGNVYVLDDNNRINVFSPWGEFIKAFGWGVNAANPEEKLQSCTFATGCLEGSEGSGAGQFDGAQAIAVDADGNLYVAEGSSINEKGQQVGNARIQKFGPEGEFIYATGYDTVAHGPDDSTNDEVQELSIAASSGTFKLSFEHPYKGGETKETAALPFNASAATVKTALNGLATIGGLGGSVTVTGGPGDASGSAPYIIVFEGNLGGDDVPQLTVDRSALGPASIGATLRCSTETEAETIEYRWLRNGVEIPGAESPSYTTVAADEGKSVQCAVTARNTLGITHAANPVYVAPPEDATPPVAPIMKGGVDLGHVPWARSDASLQIGGAGGQKLTCTPGTKWSGADSFAYRWYRNGAQIAGATESTYVVTEEDLASPAYFQCAVTASNAGTATTTAFSMKSIGGLEQTVTVPQLENPSGSNDGYFGVKMDPPGNVFTSHQGGELEVCEAGSACKAGVRGTAGGQLRSERYGDMIAASPVDGAVFVGEYENQKTGEGDRIQVFEPDGSFREAIALPKEEGVTFQGLATDEEGDLYAAFNIRHEEGGPTVFESEVRKLEPNGPSANFLQPAFVLGKADARNIISVAVDPADHVYVAGEGFGSLSTDKGYRVLEFDASGKCLNCGSQGEGGLPGFDRSDIGINAIGTGAACGSTDVYIAHFSPPQSRSYFNVFGAPPSPVLCPPPEVAPTIASQYALSVDTSSAELHARINPHFWNDTAYYVEYGTSPCSEGGCEQTQPAVPGQRLTAKTTNGQVTSPAIFLSGLEPGTTYHYRFVAESGGGGPVFGADPEGLGEATPEDGLEGTFTTARLDEAEACPENEAFRGGSSALLPDCRAYEMVSPLDKEGRDIYFVGDLEQHIVYTAFEQSSLLGDRLAYASAGAFGDAKAAPMTSQYIAARGEDGWHSHYILGPRERTNSESVVDAVVTELRALSPDLCEAWIKTFAEPLLAPNAPPGQVNLYRRTDQDCGEERYEALTTASPPHGVLSGLELRGTSADGSKAIYTARDNLTPDAPDLGGKAISLYYQTEGEGQPRFVCIGPDAAPITGSCLAGTTGAGATPPRAANLTGAISADGSRVFWATHVDEFADAGQIYMRSNPDQPESAHLHGVASGTGNLIGPAAGTGNAINGSKNISAVVETSGHFAVGQVVSGPGIPAGDKITAIAKEISGKLKLTLEKAAGAGATFGVAIAGEASVTVTNAIAKTGAFTIGQEISAANGGIPLGATIVKVEEPTTGVFTLTLSAKATETGTAVALSATSECTEADKACTVPVSAKGQAISGDGSSTFWAASEDGSRALFVTKAEGVDKGDLYEFVVDGEETRLIAKKVPGLMGASKDLSRVYFASEEVLPTEPNSEGDEPVAGETNLYLAEGVSYRFIATMASDRDPTVSTTPIGISPVQRRSRVSGDGLHTMFMSAAPLTGYDNTDAKSPTPCGEPEGRCDAEVFLYDASANGGQGKLVCASCNPSGGRPAGKQFLVGVPNGWGAARIPAWKSSLYAGRLMSEDGSRLYFEAADALSPRDSNGTVDIYQWEAPGSGGCDEGDPAYSVLNEGCVNLISSGRSAGDARFIDVSASGDDVFFATAESLLAQDSGLVDIYDARVNGGLPEPPEPAPECEGEACQSTPESPNDPTPSSESFVGAGNVREEAKTPARKPCAKGKVRRKGKCVVRKHKKAHRRAKHARRAGR